MQNELIEKLLKKKNNIKYNLFFTDIKMIDSAIVFLYAAWSSTHVQLQNLMESLVKYPDIDLYIFDIDSSDFFEFNINHNFSSHGWGETYWIKFGKVVGELKKYGPDEMEKLLYNNSIL